MPSGSKEKSALSAPQAQATDDDPFGLWRLNTITKFVADPCDAPFTVYVETLWPALLEALITYYMLDLKNIIAGFARPSKAIGRQRGMKKGRRGYKAGRKTKRGILRRALGFDPSDSLGKYFGGFFGMQDRRVSAGIVTLWIAEGLIERLLFWLLIMEIGIQFFYRWSSLLLETRYCREQHLGVLLVEGGTNLVSNIIEYNGFVGGQTVKQRGPLVWAPGGIATPRGTFQITASAKFRLIDGSPATGRVVVFKDSLDPANIVLDSNNSPPSEDGQTVATGGTVSGNHTYFVRVIVGFGLGTCYDQTFYASGKAY